MKTTTLVLNHSADTKFPVDTNDADTNVLYSYQKFVMLYSLMYYINWILVNFTNLTSFFYNF